MREPSLELLPSGTMSDAPSDAPSFDRPAASNTPSDALVVLCTVPDEPTAERLARGLVEGRLAACVNVLGGVRSFYRWKGALQDDRELLTRVDRLACEPGGKLGSTSLCAPYRQRLGTRRWLRRSRGRPILRL